MTSLTHIAASLGAPQGGPVVGLGVLFGIVFAFGLFVDVLQAVARGLAVLKRSRAVNAKSVRVAADSVAWPQPSEEAALCANKTS